MDKETRKALDKETEDIIESWNKLIETDDRLKKYGAIKNVRWTKTGMATLKGKE